MDKKEREQKEDKKEELEEDIINIEIQNKEEREFNDSYLIQNKGEKLF